MKRWLILSQLGTLETYRELIATGLGNSSLGFDMDIRDITGIICAVAAIIAILRIIWPFLVKLVKGIEPVRARELITAFKNLWTVIVLILAVAAIVLVLWPTPPSPDIKITRQDEGSKVPYETTVKGVASNIPDGSSIWICVVPYEYAELYYPHHEPAGVGEMGEWESGLCIGEPEERGKQFYVVAMLVDEGATAQFQEYVNRCQATGSWEGIEETELPSGARELDRIIVTRE